MKNKTEENRRNLDMIAPTWTLLGLALTACGGGGGGSSGFGGGNPLSTPRNPLTTPPSASGNIIAPAAQFGVGGTLSATTSETNDIAQLYALRWDVAVAVLDTIGSYDLQVDPKTVTLVARPLGGGTTTSTWTITGDDAGDFIFVAHGEGAVLQTVNPVDYENPRDANRDNVYEITLDARGGTIAGLSHILSTGDVDYTITITDDSADDRPAVTPSPVSGIVDPHVQIYSGDRSTTIIETNDIVQFYAVRWDTELDAADVVIAASNFGFELSYEIRVTPKVVTLVTTTVDPATRISNSVESTWTITGDDADDFIFVQHGSRGAVLQTVNPVDYENPRDANRDNVYEITLDLRGGLSGVGLENLAGDVDYTITVTDNSALDMI